jgi:hypothetical protein
VPNEIKNFVDQVVSVSKGVAAKSGVRFGTVMSRNPDGTLNVDPGDGGCVRVLGPENVRRGDRVAIGTEPAVGTLTELDPLFFAIPAPVEGCPTDPRDIPTSPVVQAVVSGANIIASAGLTTWAERDTDLGSGSPSNVGNWFGYRKSAAVTSGNNQIIAGYRKEVVGGGTPIQVLYTMDRSFIKIDLTGVDTAGATAATITFTVPYSGSSTSGSPRSPHDTAIAILPSTAVLPITKADMDKFDRETVLGSFRMLLNRPAFGGSGSYTVSCDLDLSSYEGELPNPLVLCLMSGFDLDGTTPPQIGPLVDNQDIQDTWTFSSATVTFEKPLL